LDADTHAFEAHRSNDAIKHRVAFLEGFLLQIQVHSNSKTGNVKSTNHKELM